MKTAGLTTRGNSLSDSPGILVSAGPTYRVDQGFEPRYTVIGCALAIGKPVDAFHEGLVILEEAERQAGARRMPAALPHRCILFPDCGCVFRKNEIDG
jgi:hypothetical protein